MSSILLKYIQNYGKKSVFVDVNCSFSGFEILSLERRFSQIVSSVDRSTTFFLIPARSVYFFCAMISLIRNGIDFIILEDDLDKAQATKYIKHMGGGIRLDGFEIETIPSTKKNAFRTFSTLPIFGIFSSGTTSEKKAIIMSHESFLTSAELFSHLIPATPGALTHYHWMPTSYMAGLFNLFAVPLARTETIILENQNPKLTALDFCRSKLAKLANSFLVTPTVIEAMTELRAGDTDTVQTLHRASIVYTTSDFCSDITHEKFIETFNIELQHCYGITELGGSVTFGPRTTSNEVGKLRSDIQINLKNDGEMVFKSATPYLGYIYNDSRIKLASDWFDPGDRCNVVANSLIMNGRYLDSIDLNGQLIEFRLIQDEIVKGCLSIQSALLIKKSSTEIDLILEKNGLEITSKDKQMAQNIVSQCFGEMIRVNTKFLPIKFTSAHKTVKQLSAYETEKTNE